MLKKSVLTIFIAALTYIGVSELHKKVYPPDQEASADEYSNDLVPADSVGFLIFDKFERTAPGLLVVCEDHNRYTSWQHRCENKESGKSAWMQLVDVVPENTQMTGVHQEKSESGVSYLKVYYKNKQK